VAFFCSGLRGISSVSTRSVVNIQEKMISNIPSRRYGKPVRVRTLARSESQKLRSPEPMRLLDPYGCVLEIVDR
jgi:hypothetical protein